MKKTVGYVLYNYRKTRGLSIDKMSKLLGLSYKTYYDNENNKVLSPKLLFNLSINPGLVELYQEIINVLKGE